MADTLKALLACGLAISAAAPAVAETCEITHYHADGTVTRSTGNAPDDGVTASASSGSRGQSSARSSVSASSRSDDGSTSISTSSHGGVGRSVAVERGARGCRVTVDERPDNGKEAK